MLRAISVLTVAAAVPYVATNVSDLDSYLPGSKTPAEKSVEADTGSSPQFPTTGVSRQGTVVYSGSAPVVRSSSISLHEVFRFDISKEWVYQRWDRKSTALAELGLYGIRVTLVTGTQTHDLAGSLTYYFAENGVLNRITFTGRTGDPSHLAMFMAQRYGLQPQRSFVVGEQLFQERYEEHVFSELKVRPASVLRADAPLDSYAVELVLQRPGSQSPLQPRLPLLEQPPAEDATAATAGEASDEKGAEKNSPEEAWKTYAPRSRVPKEQVDNLDRLNRFW